MNAVENPGDITVVFTHEEALVFGDWLQRFNQGNNAGQFQHQAEERVLFDLEAALERVMTINFSPEYARLLQAARDKIRDDM